MTNKMTDTLLQSVSELLTTSECSLVSVTLKGIQDRFCPSMKREEKKRPCKMSREAILRQFPVVFAKCPLEEFSIETNAFSATGIIELVQHMTSGQFPSLRFLNIDGSSISLLLPQTTTITSTTSRFRAWSASSTISRPQSTCVPSTSTRRVPLFPNPHLDVITHNHGIDTPFRYNFEQRYPADCAFYCLPKRHTQR
jgi:singapore isolate B (sub-type 7) whole genome shotgun sequence assembly, scaffold_0